MEASNNTVRYHHAAQPIIDVATGRVFGHELLLRCACNGEFYTPDEFRSRHKRFHLDWARIDLLIVKEVIRRGKTYNGTLLFNMSPATAGDESTMFEFLNGLCRVKDMGLCDNAGIEISENLNMSNKILSRLVGIVQSFGLSACLDDYDNGRNNIDRFTLSRWDIFKIDWRPGHRSHFDRNRINRLCDVLQPGNTRVLLEGVETETDHKEAVDTRIDLVQGFHYGRPTIQSA